MNDAASILECVEHAPHGTPAAAVLWLHGLGADGHDFDPLVHQLALPDALAVRFLLPHAPYRPVSINGGAHMRAWYDLLPAPSGWRDDEAGIAAASVAVHSLIVRETERGIPARRIVLGGFSQGGALALYAGLRHPERLAGIAALSSYLPLAGRLPVEAAQANRDAPVFFAHGTDDPLIGREVAERARDRLLAMGYTVDWHLYEMPHTLVTEEVGDLREWLVRRALNAAP